MAWRTLTLFACGLEPAAGISRGFLGSEGLLDFDSFVKTHGRDFPVGSTDYALRKDIYELRLEKIQRHNADPNRLWTAGVNHLSDLTASEFQQRLGWRHHHRAERGVGVGSMLELGRAKPLQVDQDKDYTNLTMASDGVDQGGCGSCWAVATTELLKAHYEIKNGKPKDFSTQELVSCVKNPKKCGGAGGCEGATVELALDYVMLNGLREAKELPYQGTTGTCDKEISDSKLEEIDADGRELFMASDHAHSMVQGNGLGLGAQTVGLTGFHTIDKNKYEPLMRALVELGPVGVTVAANDWDSYSEGIFNKCDDATLNHAVLLMGTGKDKGRKTYIVKNSWGGSWGEKGYIRLLRTDNEEKNCATDHSPKDGVACEGKDGGFPSSVLACGTCGILYDNVIPAMTVHKEKKQVF